MVDSDRTEKIEAALTPVPMATPFLMDLARRALGEQLHVVSEGSQHRSNPSFPGEQVAPSGDGFVTAVEEQLVVAPVLAVPSWVQDHNPLGSVIGQELVENLQLAAAKHPLGLLVPVGPLASIRGDKFREALLRHGRSLLVIEAYAVLKCMHPQVQVALVALHHERRGDRPLARFVRVPLRNPDHQVVLDDVARLLRMSGGSRPSGFVHLEPLDPYSPLNYRHYDPVLRSRKGELRTWGQGSTVGQLFDVLVPGRMPPPRSSRPDPEQVRFVSGRSIGLAGRLEMTQSDDPPKTPPLPLVAGDLVIRAIFGPTDAGGLHVAEICEGDLPASALANVMVLRPKRELSEAERLLLLRYLQSGLAKELLVALSANPLITRGILNKLYLPVAEESLLEAVGSIAEAGRLLSRWGDEAVDALDSIFALESPTAARAALIERGRESRLRVEAARAVDDFDYRVRTLFPYPVAYRWRSLNSIASKGDAQQTLREIRFGFEHILAFAGCLAAAVARQEGIDIPELRRYGATDDYKTFLSTWTDILDQVGKRTRTGQTNNPLLIHLGKFREEEETADALARLTAYRHAESHTLSLNEDELANQLVIDVQTLVHALRFLTDYELVEIVDTHWDLISKRNTVRYRAYVGDHPIVPVRNITVAQVEIDRDSLYIRAKPESTVPVMPG